MKEPKTLKLIECRRCGGSFVANDKKITLDPGNGTELPDEIAVVVRKVQKCLSCKQFEDRTLGGRRKKFTR